jgi:hypothetical protein
LFIHLFLKFLRAEISENLSLFDGASAMAESDRLAATAPLSEPETDQQNQDKGGQNEPRDHDDFDSYFADCRNVVVDVRVAVKESVTVVKNVPAA